MIDSVKKYIPDIIDLPAEYYLEKIKSNDPYSLSRFGDGEVLCMFHSTIKENCDGSKFLDELIVPMKNIFKNQYDYYHCFINCTFWTQAEIFKEFINSTCPNMPIYFGDFWADLSTDDRILDIINVLSKHKVCFIGAEHLENIKYMKGIGETCNITIPAKDAFRVYKKIKNSIINKYNNGYKFFAFSGGYSTKILIDELYPIIGKNAYMIDFGSIFDPYCGKLSRSGHKNNGFVKYQPFTELKLI